MPPEGVRCSWSRASSTAVTSGTCGPVTASSRVSNPTATTYSSSTGACPTSAAPTTLLRSFQMLRPLGDLVGYVTLWTRLHDRRAAQAIWALTEWAHDHVPFPGATFVDMVRRLSRANGLFTGTVILGGLERRLSDIKIPFLNVFGTYDHVTPPQSVAPLGELVGSADAETKALKAGHIGPPVGST